MSETVRCPKCGVEAEHETAVRQGKATIHGVAVMVADVGYHCIKCGHEWGFEAFTEGRA